MLQKLRRCHFQDRLSENLIFQTAITGIHGNFYSNPFYYNIGDTLNADGIDFIYAQTNDAFSEIETYNVKTGEKEICGSWNERFSYTDEDIAAYLKFATENYKHVILAGHSLGANKVIHYLSSHHDKNLPEHFMLLSPANITYMTKNVTAQENKLIFIEKTGHTYQQKEQEIADIILKTVQDWRRD